MDKEKFEDYFGMGMAYLGVLALTIYYIRGIRHIREVMYSAI